jgi:hypothetical protein
MKLSIIFCLFLCLTFGCSTTSKYNATNTEPNWHKRIVSKHKYPLGYLISPHIEAVNVLIVDGKRFEHVRGVEKFYIFIPKINAIVFVTDQNNSLEFYHVYKMDTKEDIIIPTANSVFGQAIDGSTDIGRRADTANVNENGIIELCTIFTNPDTMSKSYLYLDLDKRAVVAKKKLL